MKKLGLLLFAILAITMVYGQSANRTAALDFLKTGELDKAKELIDKAINHPETKDDAQTWFYRGGVSTFLSF